MILNDGQIRSLAIEQGMITPFQETQVRKTSDGEKCISFGLSSFGYDFRLAGEVELYVDKDHHADGERLDPKNWKSEDSPERLTLDYHKPFWMPPRSFLLSYTIETFDMPNNVVGVCVGKSTYARCGIILNVTPIEPGWRGQIVLELSNTMPRPVAVYPGEGVGQLLFYAGGNPMVTYAQRSGKYQDQRGITHARC